MSKRMSFLLANDIDPTPTPTVTVKAKADTTSTSCFHCNKQGHWVRDCPSKTTPTVTVKAKADTTSTSCFHCNKQGHWVRDCPSKTTPTVTVKAKADTTSTSCFHCNKQDHWVRDCPSKTTNNNTTTNDVCHLPEIECDHGHGPCTAKVSRSLKNPGRIYYACLLLLPNDCKCRFFKWYDELETKNNGTAGGRPLSLSLSRSEYPTCSCGAGLCRLMLETSQPNAAGRLYFVCPITQSHGACPFFLWYEGGATTRLDERNYELDENENDEVSFEHSNRMTFEIDNPQPDRTFNLLPFAPSEIEEEHDDDTSNMKTLSNFSNLQVVLREEGGLLDPIMEKAPPQVFQKTSLPLPLPADTIRHQHIEFWRQSCTSTAGDTLVVTGGWLGRLAFTPSGCLTLAPSKPMFCCVFPSLNPILVPNKETYGSHSEGLIDLPHTPSHSDFHSSRQIIMPSEEDDARPLSGVVFKLSGIKNLLGPLQHSVVTGKIVEALEKTALPIQNLLLTLLESMEPLEHESMTRAADCTFAALDHLSVDYRPFSKCVRKFIACASSLAEIERSIHNDLSSQQLIIKWYQSEIERFDNISRTHADIVGAFTTSDHRLQSLRKQASRVKEMLLQIENQLSLCEAEKSELKTQVDKTAKDMIESEKRLQAAAQKAEAAMELCHQSEVTRNEVKAAFEEARIKLPQTSMHMQ